MPDKLGPYELNTIVTGDARELAKAIPDESVDLIFTDPIYDRIEDYEWLAETAARVLKDNSPLLTFCGIGYLDKVLMAIVNNGLSYKWQMIGYTTNEVKRRHAPPGKCVYTSLLWLEKGKSKRKGFMLDVRATAAFSSSSNHKWSKPPLIPLYYLENMSNDNDIIFDPFSGGGTIPAICKMLNRRFLGFEIDPEVAKIGRQQVIEAKMPLPITYFDQLEMDIN